MTIIHVIYHADYSLKWQAREGAKDVDESYLVLAQTFATNREDAHDNTFACAQRTQIKHAQFILSEVTFTICG